jgi:hypothetical protein
LLIFFFANSVPHQKKFPDPIQGRDSIHEKNADQCPTQQLYPLPHDTNRQGCFSNPVPNEPHTDLVCARNFGNNTSPSGKPRIGLLAELADAMDSKSVCLQTQPPQATLLAKPHQNHQQRHRQLLI